MKYIIREIQKDEIYILDDFLYEAIFIPKGQKAPSKDIINLPQLQVYIKNFGKYPDDNCLVALVDNTIVGAIWTRIMNDYGHIDNNTPSLAIAILEDYRNHGIGTNLIQNMLMLLKQKGYKQVSLSVQKANYAYKIYQKLGFTIIDENNEEYIMINQIR